MANGPLSMWAGIKNWFTGARLLGEEIPETTAELCKLIVKNEKKGVNVDQAWQLYEKAKKLEIIERTEGESSQENASYYVQRAFGDLLRKKCLKRISNLAICTSFVFFILTIVAFVLLVKDEIPYDRIVLGVPLFIGFWGLTGSASYILLMENRIIRERLLDWFGFFKYIYRIALGGVLAAVTFYILQLGVVSLPGSIGEEVAEELERLEVIEENRKAYSLKVGSQRQFEESSKIIEAFENANKGVVEDKVDVLLEYAKKWEKLGIKYVIKSPDGQSEEIEVNLATLEGQREDYNNRKYACEEYCNKIITRIKKIKGETNPIYMEIKRDFDAAGSDLISKLKALEKHSVKWAPLEVIEVDEEERELSKIIIDAKAFGLAVKVYKEYFPRQRKIFEAEFKGVRDVIIPKMENDRREASKKLTEYEIKAKEYSVHLESIEISEKLDDVNEDIKKLRKQIEDYSVEIQRLEMVVPETEAETARLRKLKDTRDGFANTLKEKEKEKGELEKKLKGALARELGKPVWESPLFIVVAFLSGYSVKFVHRLMNRMMVAILPRKEGEPADDEFDLGE